MIEVLTVTSQEPDRIIDVLSDRVGANARTTLRLIRSLWIGFAVLLTMISVLGYLLGVTTVTNHNLTKVTDQLSNNQTVARQSALCPLYGLLNSLNTPQARALAADKAAYDASFVVIQKGYDALQCSEFNGTPVHLGPTK